MRPLSPLAACLSIECAELQIRKTGDKAERFSCGYTWPHSSESTLWTVSLTKGEAIQTGSVDGRVRIPPSMCIGPAHCGASFIGTQSHCKRAATSKQASALRTWPIGRLVFIDPIEEILIGCYAFAFHLNCYGKCSGGRKDTARRIRGWPQGPNHELVCFNTAVPRLRGCAEMMCTPQNP